MVILVILGLVAGTIAVLVVFANVMIRRQAAAGGPGLAQPTPVAERLKTLDQLKEDGTVTEAEYETERKRILSEV